MKAYFAGIFITLGLFSLMLCSCSGDNDDTVNSGLGSDETPASLESTSTAQSSSNDPKSSRAYKGHENDEDIYNLCQVYPAIIGTRLDDCQTCHSGEMNDQGGQVSNACDNCHKLMVQGTGHSFTETLNGYGQDYLTAGRDQAAIQAIKELDSDLDTFKNDTEIMALRYPGNSSSQPNQPVAPLKTLSMAEIKAMPAHEEFLLANASKQQFDTYASYGGVTFEELFDSLNIDLTGASGITIIAPDGFTKSLPIESVTEIYPQPLFYSGLDTATLGSDCGFVEYPPTLPDGITDQMAIPGEFRLMLGYEREGVAMDSCYLDVVAGKIEGEGPYRLILPQSIVGAPDRGLKYSPSGCDDPYDYDETKDHNAGAMVRGAMAIRIDPMPTGLEEFDYMNGGWAYIDSQEIIIYGHNIE